jgi:hypothetical protein
MTLSDVGEYKLKLIGFNSRLIKIIIWQNAVATGIPILVAGAK